jgi:DNA-binding XRE family transcriptional regulator
LRELEKIPIQRY